MNAQWVEGFGAGVFVVLFLAAAISIPAIIIRERRREE